MKKLLVIVLTLGLAAPALAADWNFYGQARYATFWTDFDAEDLEDEGVSDDEGLLHYLQSNSRIGARVKVNDRISGLFEYGTGVNVRRLFGTYSFGSGSLLVGQEYTPTSNYFYSNSVFGDDGDLKGRGQFYAGFRPMVQVTLGGFRFALVSPITEVDSLGSGAGAYSDVDVFLPKLEASYSFKSDAFFIDVFGGYQTYELENADEDTLDITAYTLGAGGGVILGPLTLSVAANFGQNYAAYGINPTFKGGPRQLSETFATYAGPAFDGVDDVEDSDAMQAMFVANFKMSNALAFEAGMGWAQYEPDIDDSEFTEWQYYANALVSIAPGFFIVPEVGMINVQADDFGDIEDAGEIFYAGLKWQINF